MERQEREKDNMLRLRGQGYSYGAIGALYGISRQRIHQVLSGYGSNNKGLKGNGWYRHIQEVVFQRDDHTCQKCASRDNLLAHHINGDDNDNALVNLITLCSNCHLALHRPAHYNGMKLTADDALSGLYRPKIRPFQALHRVLVGFRRNWRFFVGL